MVKGRKVKLEKNKEAAMLIRDIMTTNVVSIPSTTSLADARRIMDVHRVKHLPVIDKEKLVGMVTLNALDKAGPSAITAFSKQELNYLLNRLTVKEVMSRDLITISPDDTVVEAMALARLNKSRLLLAMEDGHLVGIVTTSDFFYNVLDRILGIGQTDAMVLAH
jgi:acetoin utilization protein AcuB